MDGEKKVVSSDFDTSYNLSKTYFSAQYPYLPLEAVLDLEHTFPNVTTIDYKEFWEQHRKDKGLKIWVMEELLFSRVDEA